MLSQGSNVRTPQQQHQQRQQQQSTTMVNHQLTDPLRHCGAAFGTKQTGLPHRAAGYPTPQAGLPFAQCIPPTLALRLPQVLVWRCKHPHGLFSMFSIALGHAHQCAESGKTLVVDWSGDDLLYQGPPEQPNLWSAFFMQPAELVIERETLNNLLMRGQFVETDSNDAVFGALRGVMQGYGGIPKSFAAYGRAFVRETIALRVEFARRLHGAIDQILGSRCRWLAVHVRRSDKGVEAEANMRLTDGDILERVIRQCIAWRCDGVFLCTDDADLKTRSRVGLTAGGIQVATYDSALSTIPGQATHFDQSVDGYRKAEDVVMECFMMARGCYGLLSTYSNVSAAAVYLSSDNYPYTTFWDECALPEAPMRSGQDSGSTKQTQRCQRVDSCRVAAFSPASHGVCSVMGR